MDLGRSITYVFQDPKWLTKVLVGGLLIFIPIFGWLVVAGYWLRLIRQVTQGTELPLPEWNDFGNDFVRGARFFVVGIVWSLPLIVLEVFASAATTAGRLGSGTSVLNPFTGLGFGASCLIFLLSLGVAFMQPLFVSRLAVTESIAAAVDFTAVFNEARRIPTSLLLALVMSWAVSLAALIGLVLCFVGVAFSGFVAYTVLAHVYGQVRREAEGASPIVPGTLA
jgi:Protein of unknown function (DUF4013)